MAILNKDRLELVLGNEWILTTYFLEGRRGSKCKVIGVELSWGKGIWPGYTITGHRFSGRSFAGHTCWMLSATIGRMHELGYIKGIRMDSDTSVEKTTKFRSQLSRKESKGNGSLLM